MIGPGLTPSVLPLRRSGRIISGQLIQQLSRCLLAAVDEHRGHGPRPWMACRRLSISIICAWGGRAIFHCDTMAVIPEDQRRKCRAGPAYTIGECATV